MVRRSPSRPRQGAEVSGCWNGATARDRYDAYIASHANWEHARHRFTVSLTCTRAGLDAADEAGASFSAKAHGAERAGQARLRREHEERLDALVAEMIQESKP